MALSQPLDSISKAPPEDPGGPFCFFSSLATRKQNIQLGRISMEAQRKAREANGIVEKSSNCLTGDTAKSLDFCAALRSTLGRFFRLQKPLELDQISPSRRGCRDGGEKRSCVRRNRCEKADTLAARRRLRPRTRARD